MWIRTREQCKIAQMTPCLLLSILKERMERTESQIFLFQDLVLILCDIENDYSNFTKCTPIF